MLGVKVENTALPGTFQRWIVVMILRFYKFTKLFRLSTLNEGILGYMNYINKDVLK